MKGKKEGREEERKEGREMKGGEEKERRAHCASALYFFLDFNVTA